MTFLPRARSLFQDGVKFTEIWFHNISGNRTMGIYVHCFTQNVGYFCVKGKNKQKEIVVQFCCLSHKFGKDMLSAKEPRKSNALFAHFLSTGETCKIPQG